jgi:hypothetical protein
VFAFVEFLQPHSPSSDILVNLILFTGRFGVATQNFSTSRDDRHLAEEGR